MIDRVGDLFGLLSSKSDAVAAWSQAGAALLSAFALLLTLWVFVRQQRLSRWQLRLHREDAIIVWSRSCLGVLAEIEERAMASDPLVHGLTTEVRLGLRSRLSALIDEGRLFFPNIKDPVKGRTKHGAYQGHRQAILDPLVAVYDALKLDWDGAAAAGDLDSDAMKQQLNLRRRDFVTEAQAAIDPRTFNQVRA